MNRATYSALRPLALGLLAALVMLGLSRCIEPEAIQCPTGVVCPPGKKCAKNQPVCIVSDCGDGVVDPGEACDDGNVSDGDGCSDDCLSVEICGNGEVDTALDEVCDDGNTVDGDGCSADCKSNQLCGNHIVDTAVGEVCDDGNRDNNDGCRSDCLSDEKCGTGEIDDYLGEKCDDGNTVDGDGCSADCKSNEQCGNGIVDLTIGEFCDSGGVDSSNCDKDCTSARCDDGYTNKASGEQCDDSGESAVCNSNCTPTRCGDTIINRSAGEVCDDGNTTSGDRCSADCRSTEFCGNRIVDTISGEECDEGAVDTAHCTKECRATRCGDGYANEVAGEECDSGGADSAACNGATCTLSQCGDGHVNGVAGEVCDDGDAEGGDGCSADCTSDESCGNHVTDPGEECDDGVNVDTFTCNKTCTLARCGDRYVNTAREEECDDAGETASCNINCTLTECGDGLTNRAAGEICDDGDRESGDGCSSDCRSSEFCGNHYIDAALGETCDEGAVDTSTCDADCSTATCGDGYKNEARAEECDTRGESASCNSNCTLTECGDRIINRTAGEVCDDGNVIEGDGCSSNCRSEEDCGNRVVDPGEQCDYGGFNADNADCLAGCQLNMCGDGKLNTAGPDRIEECDDGGESATCNANCTTTECGDGIVNPTAGEQCDLLGGGSTARCDSDCTIAFCGDGFLNSVRGELCDDAGESATCNLDCTQAGCGDGVLNRTAGEQCDDHGETTRCNLDCTLAYCGDGVVNAARHETCDDAGESESCDADCTAPQCGDGMINRTAGEQCDNVGAVNTAQCDSNCSYAYCGDGFFNSAAGEACDDGGNSATCNANCTEALCGDGFVNSAAGEQCDARGDSVVCNATCRFSACGDGYTNPAAGETCDTAGESATCDDDCSAVRCGDRNVNEAHGEACDDGGESDRCNANCTLAACGDGIVNATHGESCDDSGESATCNGDCTTARCGDSKRNATAGEACDTGAESATCDGDCSATVCGDNHQNTLAGEQCDDGNAVTEPTCPFGQASCYICDATCRLVERSGGVCGDGFVDDSNETCDDANTLACGTCSSDCQTPQLAAASGTIQCVPRSALTNNQLFTLNDGKNAVTFEFKKNNNYVPQSGRITVDVRDVSTDIGVARRVAEAINTVHGAGGLQIGATFDSTKTVALAHDQQGSFNHGITTYPVVPGFVVTGMAGGLGRDCVRGTGCARNEDCEPGLACSGGTCQPPSFTLTVARSGNGAVTSDTGGIACGESCSATYEQNTTVELTATADVGWHLASWSGGGCASDNPCYVLVDAAKSVTATFERTSYTIGGTVSGLASGATLVLKDNGTDSLSITANGAFTFDTPVLHESTYAVTIGTDPASPPQVCTVSNGSGTVDAANVTSVSVTCVSKWSIGGTLSGLASGASVVLRNNGGDDLTLSANGAFSFPTLLLNGSGYAVTVLTNPTVPRQTCAVTAGSGTATANVSSVQVTCTTNRYTVGGTISGLTGTGLVLQNNLGDDLTVASGATSFIFPTSVLSGTNYSVTVKTQPQSPNQSCSISSGTGTVGGANVTSVRIVCSNRYSVGGTVTGLTGSGLVLHNGTEDLPVSGSTFTFATLLASGAAYNVSVTANPTDPSQTCTVAHGSGTIASANVTNVVVTCTTNSYTVGGTLTGLADGATVVLENNDSDPLSLSANGVFTFSAAILSGAGYSVTVRTQPHNPKQNCSVSSGTGTVGGANVTSVRIVCGDRYSVGGTVSGLSGSGLVLHNGTEDLPVSGPSFTFATLLANGDAYDVSVTTNPTDPSQTCTVANGSGTIASADVTNVVVTCTTNSYTVGGTLTGLAEGATVVLENNDSDPLSLSANGDFTFSAGILSGAAYRVEVRTAPTTPPQVCTVTNATGTVGASNVTNVAVDCSTRYSIGGTVTGLSGSGLVLHNGTEDLPVSGSPFTFATLLANGTGYDVSVTTNPTDPSQTCTVANGSGTIASANVTSIQVTCTTNTYAIGGTLTGLAGGVSVVLQNNGGDAITLTANSSFAFPTPVASNAAYLVDVSTQPLGQVCTVTNGSGTVGAADVTSVSVSCVSSYQIGGTLSGLGTGKTVVLQNNGGDALTLTADGIFHFNTELLGGAAYLVTVGTQPDGQLCSVTAGSGTVASADVTSVVVDCASAYKLGGTLTGLGAGKTVVLRNNGADPLTLTANGDFSFATPVANGSTYLVTVATQPDGQVCSVTAGSGTVGAAEVSSVVVDCAAGYRIGGTLTGLGTGKSIVLQNNGADTLTLSADSSFQFTTLLASGSAYAVTILTQPDGQLCSLAHESGTIGTADVSNVQVTCEALYSIGGSVSGLSGTGLRLLNGGEELTVASGATSFTFATQQAIDTSYAVTVGAQPTGPSQTCSIAAGTGSGTVSGNVTTVAVSCVTNSYQIGVTVTGAGSTGLVLLNNGGDSLTATEGPGSYFFATKVESGESYAVTVGTAPTGQACTVSNGTGTVADADVSNVTVACVSSGT